MDGRGDFYLRQEGEKGDRNGHLSWYEQYFDNILGREGEKTTAYLPEFLMATYPNNT